jgi:hypothetical protein
MLAARNVDKLAELAAETKAVATPRDAGDPAPVAALVLGIISLLKYLAVF